MNKPHPISRRVFLGRSLGTCASAALADHLIAAEVSQLAMDKSKELDFPLVDLHVRLDNSMINRRPNSRLAANSDSPKATWTMD